MDKKLTPGQFDEMRFEVVDLGGAFPELREKRAAPKFKEGRRTDARLFAKRTMDRQKTVEWCVAVDELFLNSPFNESFLEELLKDVQMHGRRDEEWNETWKSWSPSKRLLHSLMPDAAIAGIVEKVGNPRLFLSADAYFALIKEGRLRPS